MSRQRVRGLVRANALLDRLAPAARHELQDLLGPIARDIEAQQKQLVAKRSGYLRDGLESKVDAERLRALVGLFSLGSGRSASRHSRFYGRVVEGGRTAQTVLVTRRVKKRKIKGNGRNGTTRRVTYLTAKRKKRSGKSPNAGTFVGDPYKLRVKAKAARPYIRPPGAREAADRRLADFWARTFAQAGGSA